MGVGEPSSCLTSGASLGPPARLCTDESWRIPGLAAPNTGALMLPFLWRPGGKHGEDQLQGGLLFRGEELIGRFFGDRFPW